MVPLMGLFFAVGTSGGAYTPDYSAITAAVTAAFADVTTNCMSIISAMIPYAVAIAGALIVVRVGMRAFRSIGGGR